ncbi:hypothetical protein [Moorena producens]|uniref:hypothetical protein n=1 Tax=Moorena producens TaxID=1155739 RepID=UPI0013140CAD|nr:hypothetical protein [Moorena producens]
MGNAHQYPRYIVGWALLIKFMIEPRAIKWEMPTNAQKNVELRMKNVELEDNRRVGIAD